VRQPAAAGRQDRREDKRAIPPAHPSRPPSGLTLTNRWRIRQLKCQQSDRTLIPVLRFEEAAGSSAITLAQRSAPEPEITPAATILRLAAQHDM
jgi:hypothetical protein